MDVDKTAGGGIIGINSTPHASPGNGEADQAGSCISAGKMPLSIPELADHLLDKGMSFDDCSKGQVENFLTQFGYYRLRGYWMTLECDGQFISGTRFYDVLEIIQLEQDLKNFLLKAITPIEIALRASLAQTLAMRYGDRALEFAGIYDCDKSFGAVQDALRRETGRERKNNTPFVIHNLNTYGYLPIWAAVETLSFGTLSKLYGGLGSLDDMHIISSPFGVRAPIFKSWMEYLVHIRNICAHQSRLYNRILTVRPRLFREHRGIDNARLFPVFIVLLRLHDGLDPARAAGYRSELAAIMDAHADVDLVPMGFPQDWRRILALPEPERKARPRGRNGGRKPRDPNALPEALRLYDAHELPIAAIVERTGVSTSTLYKYIHLRE